MGCPGSGHRGRGFHRYRRLTEQGLPRGRPLVRLRAPQCVHDVSGIVDGSAPPLHPAHRGDRDQRQTRRRQRLGGDRHTRFRRGAHRSDARAAVDAAAVGATHRRAAAGRYQTIMPPSTVADMMIYLGWSMAGRGAQEGRTAFSAPGGGTRVGERLTELPLTLFTDPAAPGLACTPFVAVSNSSETQSVFDNGMEISQVDWIRSGVINALAYPRATAAKFDAPVAVAADNLIMTGGSADLADMIAGTERGLLLTTLWYIREVDPTTLLLTGLTRDGVYLVEDGEVSAAVNNFRFNESPLDLLRRATEAGVSEPTLPREWSDWVTRTAMPPLRIPDFHMSSVSQAQ
ncbi:hypothetical protein B9D06_00990 [Mycobacterium tuberculosis]|nr:hypothetical protein B9D06_00990 [Mycobacterium tuberculosis]